MSQDFEPVIASVDQSLVNNDLFVVPNLDVENTQDGAVTQDGGNTAMHVARTAGKGVLRGGEFGVLVAEVTPINEAMRVAIGAAAIKFGLPPEGVAAVYGGATLAIEGTAAIVAARWLSSDRSKKTVDWFNEKLTNFGISPTAKFNKVTKAGIVFFGGSAIASAVEVREKPEMEKAEIRNYGLKVATLLAGACAVQGYFVGQGIETPSPATIGGATIAAGSVFGLAGIAQRRVNREQAEQGIDTKALKAEAKDLRKQEKLERKTEKLNTRNAK